MLPTFYCTSDNSLYFFTFDTCGNYSITKYIIYQIIENSMSENDEVSFDTKENNDENIPADQRSIRVTIRSNLDPIVIEIAGDDNVDFIKQNILIGSS